MRARVTQRRQRRGGLERRVQVAAQSGDDPHDTAGDQPCQRAGKGVAQPRRGQRFLELVHHQQQPRLDWAIEAFPLRHTREGAGER